MNRPAHMVIGGLTTAVAYAFIKNFLKEQPTPGEALFFAAAGAFVGILPDVIEPATSPRHRGFFHSIALLSVLGYLAYRFFWCKDLTKEKASATLAAFIAAYGSHLILDGCTPAGLPLLTNGF